ncbi:TPA: hypothetical protein N6R22_003079 [Escherichia coli]|nr:hypothetical protein [Escherichia coli]
MRPDQFFYPDTFTFNSSTYYGQRDSSKGRLYIPIESDLCPFNIGDIIVQKMVDRERLFEVLDYEVQISLEVGCPGYSYLAVLIVKALDVKEKPKQITTHLTFNGAINAGGDFQAGNDNSITKNITIQQLHDAIEHCNDPEVKSLWQKLLENPTFASIASILAKSALGQ